MIEADDRGPLAKQIDLMIFQCRMETGQEATHIFLPKKSPSEIKRFVEALCDEVDIGKPSYVYACFMDGREASFRDLKIALYDGSELIVGGEHYLQ